MSRSLLLRPLPILVISSALLACAGEPRSSQPASHAAARVQSNVNLSDVPIGPGWEVAGDAPIRADVPIGAGWDARRGRY
jgi:hypothetical protein